jgi:hypothetical protein
MNLQFNEGRRKKEEGRRKKEEGLYMWIRTPTQNERPCVLVGVLKSLFEFFFNRKITSSRPLRVAVRGACRKRSAAGG